MFLAQRLLVTLILGLAGPPEDMGDASETFTRAEQRLAAGDEDGAIALFEQGLARLPADPGYAPARAEVLLTIVAAHESAFARDHALARLLRAKALLDRYLGPLDLLDEQGRAAAEQRRVRLIDTITAVQAALRAEAEARAAAVRRARAEAARRRGRSLTLAGASLSGLGAAGLVMMVTGMGLGRATDGRISDLKAERAAMGDDWSRPCVDDDCREARRGELGPLLARGSASNGMLVSGAVLGAALLAAGVGLLAAGRKQQRAARALAVAPTFARGGVGLAVQGRF
ncbi:MAG: hypothetical protein JNL82_37660 [Myxococcales bacterium]|nr:hypothetical protein [Myxococcales bacterium]